MTDHFVLFEIPENTFNIDYSIQKTFYSGKENPNTPFVHCPTIIPGVLILIVVEVRIGYKWCSGLQRRIAKS